MISSKSSKDYTKGMLAFGTLVLISSGTMIYSVVHVINLYAKL